MTGTPLTTQISRQRSRAADLEAASQWVNQKGPNAAQRTHYQKEADELSLSATEKELQLKELMEATEDKMRDLAAQRAALVENSAEKVLSIERQSAFYDQRSLTPDRKETLNLADMMHAEQLSIAAAAERRRRIVEIAAIEDHLRELQEGTAALGETTGEKILRLKRDALRLEERSRDTSVFRTQEQRDADRVAAAEKTAAAAQLEYQWRNKPLTVEEAVARTKSGRRNTTAAGAAAANIQRASEREEYYKRQGNLAEANRYREKKNKLQDHFDRAAEGKEPFNGEVTHLSDMRNGAQLAGRNAAIDKGLKDRQSRLSIPSTAASTFQDSASAAAKLANDRQEKKVDKAAASDPMAQAVKWGIENAQNLKVVELEIPE